MGIKLEVKLVVEFDEKDFEDKGQLERFIKGVLSDAELVEVKDVVVKWIEKNEKEDMITWEYLAGKEK